MSITMGDGGAPAGPKSGELIGGMYRVGRAAGRRGDMNAVVAKNTHTNEVVEVSIYSPDPPRELTREERGKFLGEARAAAKLAKEHVVRILDVGSMPDGSPYIVQQYFEGEDLAALLSRRGKVPVSEALLYGIQICEALAEAHALGLVHADLQPSAILFAKEPGRAPTLKVRGFGVARPSRNDRRQRMVTRLEGSPWYMAPEQLEGGAVDARVDVWSVGIILHELATGEVPFDAPTATAVVAKVVGGVPEIRREVIGHLDPIIRRCLAPNPSDRYTRISDLLKSLRAPDASFVPNDQPPNTVPSAPPMVVADEELEFVGDDDVTNLDDDEEIAAQAELVSAIPPPARVPDEATTPILLPPVASVPPAPPRPSTVPRPSSLPPKRQGPVSDKVPSAKARAAEKALSEKPPAVTEKAKSEKPPAGSEKAKSEKPPAPPLPAKAKSERPAPPPAPTPPAVREPRTVTTDRPPKPRDEVRAAAAPASSRSPIITGGAIAVVAVIAAILIWKAGKKDETERPTADPATPSASTSGAPAMTSTTPTPPAQPETTATATAMTTTSPPASAEPTGTTTAPTKPPATAAATATAPATAAANATTTATAPATATAAIAALVPKTKNGEVPTTTRDHSGPAPATTPAAATTPAPAATPAAASADDDATVAFQVARQHNAQLKAVCWDNSDKTTMVANVTATVEQGGAVRSVTVASTDVNLSKCIEGQVRTWTYPPSSSMRALRFPIRFRR